MNKKYEIYPQPQKISYQEGFLEISDTVHLVLEEGLDCYTVKKAKQILKNQDIEFKVSDSLSSEGTNLLVGIKDSTGLVDQYYHEEITAKNYFDEIDAYNLSIKESGISILGKDSDAAFYGLVSLEHILNQSLEKKLRKLFIEDYADTQIRGVIEGYYGVPWGNDNRADLLKFGGQFKANAFVFAPKDDPYHRERWWDLYPADELKGHKRLAKLGNETKNRYVWTIAPFQADSNPIQPKNEEEGTAKLIAKFEQLYDVGVRQFGVLGDDVGDLPRQTVVNIMKKVSDWAKSKGDVYDFVFVPQGYVLADWGFDADELNLYDDEFPNDVQIMFTGQQTLASVTQESVTDFKTKGVEEGERRDPLFWLNWPVNDIDRKEYRRLFMGKGEMLETGINHMIGVLTNPLEESQPSKVAIFEIADYSWNITDFDMDKNWKDSFEYIESGTPKALHEIAKHMSNMDNGGIEGLEESEELKEPIAAFNEAIESVKKGKIKEKGLELQNHYQEIVEAVTDFMENGSAKNLKKEMKPYVSNLHDKSEAAVIYIDIILMAKGIKNTDINQVKEKLAAANEKYENSQSYTVHTKTAEFPTVELRAESGTLRINPNLVDLKNYAKESVEAMK
ncbi:MAG: beta-N-acetylglucosaminidase domain-containing protein [Atopostipes sp.]|nr:beta-N-acetylglucosaminidase domain-containing protein [Atopostipes sp.]